MDGIFNVNKPVGMTSHDVVARARRLTRQKRVGHAGTLDPAASGVLPICLGQATRVAEYLSASGKAYRATVRFGVVTDTYDGEGEILRTAPVTLTMEDIAAALPAFLGRQLQVPPIYSAIKRAGQPLYKLARAGAVVTAEARQVDISALSIVRWESPDLIVDVECSKGTYIRSLAFDLGERLGPGAHLAGLVRTRSGPFTLATSLTLEDLERALAGETWRDHLYAPDEALLDQRAAILGAAGEARVRTGQLLRLVPPTAPASPAVGETIPASGGVPDLAPPMDVPLLRAYAVDGRFLGILRWEPTQAAWHPYKVLLVEPVD
jgi:tRNA pseudouridine55 synthase